MIPQNHPHKSRKSLFSFSALPGPITCFEGVQLLRAGHFLEISPSVSGRGAGMTERAYWQMDFPDAGQEVRGDDE
jgi:asparagine synthase (glutamine-hydrolysing)